MSLDACARLVEQGDPDRFAALLAAPPQARPRLLPLYAFNLEVARAPWASSEPMIAEMRLQWWRDALDGPRPAHEVAGPLHDLIRAANLPIPVLDRMAAAHRWDIWREPFEDRAAFDAYLDDTAGSLMALAAQATGAPPEAEAPARALGWASGLAAFLRAVPDLIARDRRPLLDDSPAALSALAQDGLARLDQARGSRRLIGPAALAAWQTAPLLRLAAAEPARIAHGQLTLSEFSRRGRLLWAATTGRW